MEDDEPIATSHRIDYGGIAALSIGLLALLLALDEGVDLGWTDPFIVALFAASGLALAVFVAVERLMGANALVPSEVLKNRAFTSACMATLMMSALALIAPGRRPGDTPMLALYLWTFASAVLAHAVFLDLPASAAWGGVAMGLVAVPLAVKLCSGR